MKKDLVVIDIDGCLNHYPEPLKMWAEVLLNLDKSESRQAIKKKNDFDLLKKTYRQSRILQYLLPREGVQEALGKIKKSGYSITLLSARNPDKNPDIKNITVNWLDKNKIPFDSIVFTKDKSAYVKQNKNKIAMIVEDDPKFLNSFEKSGAEMIAFKNDLNGDVRRLYFHTVSSWKEIESLFKNLTAK